MNNFLHLLKPVLSIMLLSISTLSGADVLVAPSPSNLLTVSVLPNVTKDPNTQMYTYSYTITNNTGSQQSMWLFSVAISSDAQIYNSTAPKGWLFSKNIDGKTVGWAAVLVDNLPSNYVDNGSEVPSPYMLKPGQTLSGFSFQSLNAPDTGTFYAQGFTQSPTVSDESDAGTDSIQPPYYTNDSYTSDTTSATKSIYEGGRRPAVDGFLVFLNLQKGTNTFSSPAYISIKFSAAGETVYRNTFKATLNGVDVTNLFVPDTSLGGDMIAIFATSNSPLVSGRNVLTTSVDGLVPGSTRVATDVDRITLDVQ